MRLSLSRNQIIMVIIALGLFFLALSFYVSRSSSGPEVGLKIATLIRQTGKVEIIHRGLTQRIKVDSRADVSNLDSVETFEVGGADLVFESGFRVHEFENSLVTLERIMEKESFHINLIVQRGDVRVDQNGQERGLFILKNGSPLEASLYDDSELHRLPVSNPVDDASITGVNSSNSNSTLSEEDISTTMNSHRTSFFKCYARLVQKNPRVTGEATLTFTVENSGKPGLINVGLKMNPPSNDDEFVRCLSDVVQRISFKIFTGPSVSTIFPLKFE